MAAVVVYDITSAESFDKAKFWVKELQQQGNPDAVVALAGNKVDAEAQRSVTADTAKVSSSLHGTLYIYIYIYCCSSASLQHLCDPMLLPSS